MENKFNNENYITIQGFMINDLKLKGNELLVYAIIYGITQDGETEFYGSRSYLASACNTSLPTIDKALNLLIEKELIIKTTETKNGVIFNKYKVSKETLQGIKKLYRGYKETLQGYKETLYNNKIYNKEDNKNNNIYNVSLHNNFNENERCEYICSSTNERCLRKSSYNINGINYCNQHSRGIIPDIDNLQINKKDEQFEQFYKEYPKKVGKAYAQKSFEKIKLTDDLFNLIITNLKKQKEVWEHNKTNKQYIPNPSTWLNQERWNDDIIFIETEKEKRDRLIKEQYEKMRKEGKIYDS